MEEEKKSYICFSPKFLLKGCRGTFSKYHWSLMFKLVKKRIKLNVFSVLDPGGKAISEQK
jgi:hypothetical protein